MPLEPALAFIRANNSGRKTPPVAIVFGPHAFLREYVLDQITGALRRDGWQHRGYQIGPGDDYGEMLNELQAPDLFAPKRVVVCRVLRSRRDRPEESESSETKPSGTGGSEAALAAAIEEGQSANHLVLIYERDSAPAKVRRAAEKSALLVNCMRPFDNQIEQYANAFAQALGLKLSGAAMDMLISRHGGDLAAISNALSKVMIFAEPGKNVQPADLDEPGARRMPEAFELADSVANGRVSTALAQMGRAIALGRDTIEILAVEIIPLLRRMMIAASMLAARRSTGDIASALGLPPQSGLATRAIEGARRYGLARLERAYWQACLMDERFKNGEMKERQEALSGLILDLMGNANG